MRNAAKLFPTIFYTKVPSNASPKHGIFAEILPFFLTLYRAGMAMWHKHIENHRKFYFHPLLFAYFPAIMYRQKP